MPQVQDVQIEPQQGAYRPVTLRTARGEVRCRQYPSEGAVLGCVWVPGAIGGWHSPAMGLYPRLAEEFARRRITSLQVHYRHTGDMHGCVADVTAGLDFLESEGVRAAALVGHSLGGAVVIQAASEWPLVVTAVALATQSYGAVGPAATLGPRCSLMLAHGGKDEILPTACSIHVYKAAREPKRFLLLQGARHGLDEGADELADSLRDWIGTELRRAEGRVSEHSAG